MEDDIDILGKSGHIICHQIGGDELTGQLRPDREVPPSRANLVSRRQQG